MSPGTTARALALTVQHQKMSEWCWAAVSVSVNRFFRPDSAHTQCELAGAELKLPCCDDPPTQAEKCNTSHTLHTVLGTLHLLDGEPLLTTPDFDRVQQEIDAGHPICLLIRWLDKQGKVTDQGHFIAIHGYRVTPLAKFVSIGDPFFGASEIDFTQLSSPKGGYRDGRGVWVASFFLQNEALRS